MVPTTHSHGRAFLLLQRQQRRGGVEGWRGEDDARAVTQHAKVAHHHAEAGCGSPIVGGCGDEDEGGDAHSCPNLLPFSARVFVRCL